MVPVTAGGIILLVFAAACLWFEVRYLPGVGLYAMGGWLCLTLGGFFLRGELSGAHPVVVLPTATLTAAGTTWRDAAAGSVSTMTPSPDRCSSLAATRSCCTPRASVARPSSAGSCGRYAAEEAS